MNSISSTIFYNTRIILSAPIETPVAWHCSKVEQTSPKGITRLTFVQELWNPNTDVFEYNDGSFSNEYDDTKYVVGMWADYSINALDTVPEPKVDVMDVNRPVRCEISHSGLKPQLKIGGSYKTFTVKFYNIEDELLEHRDGEWSFDIQGMDINDIPITVLTSQESSVLSDNQVKVKLANDSKLLGRLLNITYVSDVSNSISVEIVGL